MLDLLGNFSVAWAPMMWEDAGIGSICVVRQPPRPFSEKELALLKTFGDQAVIAIQNARLFHAGAGSARGGRGGERGEELPRHDEPRDPHADERGPRDERTSSRHAAQHRAARLRDDDPRFGRRAPHHHQRHPRLLEDRGRADGHRGAAVRSARLRRIGARPRQRARRGEAPRHRVPLRRRRAAGRRAAT